VFTLIVRSSEQFSDAFAFGAHNTSSDLLRSSESTFATLFITIGCPFLLPLEIWKGPLVGSVATVKGIGPGLGDGLVFGVCAERFSTLNKSVRNIARIKNPAFLDIALTSIKVILPDLLFFGG
jgi:hypothetical protein